MTPTRRAKIQSLAEAVRTKYELTSPVTQAKMRQLVLDLGGVLYVTETLDKDVDGRICKVNDGATKFSIEIPKHTPETRDRFTIAHEIGHLFVHMGYMTDSWDETESEFKDSVKHRKGRSVEESEANEFAASLLMPAREFRAAARKHLRGDTYDVAEIAKEFGVSVQAATLRGQWLGLFAW